MILYFFALLSFAQARQTVGEMYAIGKVEGAPLYIQKTKLETDAKNHSTLNSVILDSAGKTLMTELAEFDGLTIKRQVLEQRQKSEAYELNYVDRELTIKKFSVSGGERKLVKEGKSTVSDTLLTGPVSESFVGAHWDELVNGKVLEARFAVMEITDTIHFRFSKISADANGLTVEMKPSGMFIRLIAGLAGVDPIHMTLDNKEHRIVRYRGRTPLIDANKKPWDGEIVYRPALKGEEI